jgi:hypothetical protein
MPVVGVGEQWSRNMPGDRHPRSLVEVPMHFFTFSNDMLNAAAASLIAWPFVICRPNRSSSIV